MKPIVSVIIPNFNRRSDIEFTLNELKKDSYPALEIIVVDNGSTDGSVQLIEEKFPSVLMVGLPYNIATEARNYGIMKASGEYILMLDSDSHPLPGSIKKMVEHFEDNPLLGAAAFRVVLPNDSNKDDSGGRFNVFIGCGCGFRRNILQKIGCYPQGFGFYVEEYDVSYRIMAAGYKVRYFEDLVVLHRQSQFGRDDKHIIYYLIRNNIYLYFQYHPFLEAMKELSWVLFRYYRVSLGKQTIIAFTKGILAGLGKTMISSRRQKYLSNEALDSILPERNCRKRLMEIMEKQPIKTVALWGIGKDFEPIVRGIRKMGVSIIGAVPTGTQFYFQKYSNLIGVPVLKETELEKISCQALIVSSCSPGETHNQLQYLKTKNIPMDVIPLFRYGWSS